MGAFELPALPYPDTALAPHISQETLQFHHGKHHAAYVNKLNGIVEANSALQGKSLEDIIKTEGGVTFNQAAQVWNHTFYWNCMAPNAGGECNVEPLKSKINADFGSFDAFKTQFSAACGGHFGSGWAWLVLGQDGKLKISQTHDAGCPLKEGVDKPILTCDVWEHAYYVDYRNARPEYVKAWWNLVNWDFANKNLQAAS